MDGMDVWDAYDALLASPPHCPRGGIYWLFTRLFGNNNATESPHPATTEESTQEAIDILNKRYARGEIDEEEYTRRKEHFRELQ